MKNSFNIKVLERRNLTVNAVELTLEKPNDPNFTYQSGQFITLQLIINDKTYKRCYSLSSSPELDSHLKIAVKRIQGGKVSNYIHQNVMVGSEITIKKPAGKFKILPKTVNRKDYYFFTAGSGITPIISMIKSILETEKHSKVYLMYGNRNQHSIMYISDLNRLSKNPQFMLKHFLSSPELDWSDLWKSKNKKQYTSGRIQSENILSFITENHSISEERQFFICCPEDLAQQVKVTLRIMDIPKEKILSERFTTNPAIRISEGRISFLQAQINAKIYRLKLNQNQTILSALIKENAQAPHSCEGGICGTCQCKLIKGSVKMKMNSYLTDEEISDGLILACQAIATSDEIEISFD